MVGSVRFGVDLVAGDPNLTFIFFVALVLLGALGVRFSFYAFRNDRVTDLASQARLWRLLIVVGLTAALYALLGVVEIVSSVGTPFRRAVLLAHVLALTLALDALYRAAVPAAEGGDDSDRTRRITLIGTAIVVIVFLGSLLGADAPPVTAVEGLAALGLAVAGITVGRRGATASRVQGTVVDTLLRHLLPVLVFASLIPISELAVLATLDRAIVLHIQVVFVIMTATALMTATIKLRQNLAGR
jgi:hypothetical protein